MTPSWKSRLEDIVVSVVAVLIGLVLIFPIIYCFCGAFKTAAEFTQPELLPGSFRNLDNFRQALTQAPLLRYMLNSCIVAFLGSSVRMVISLLAAYAFTYFDFPGRKFCFFLKPSPALFISSHRNRPRQIPFICRRAVPS